MKALRILQQLFGTMPSGTVCGQVFGSDVEGDALHVWESDSPAPDDVCTCGSFYYRAVNAAAQDEWEAQHAELHEQRHAEEAKAQVEIQAALALDFQKSEEERLKQEAEEKQKQEQQAAAADQSKE